MTVSHFDFAIVGNTQQARLLAGMLVAHHGKTVALQGESQSGYRLARGLDLSVGPLTRPESWSLLKALLPETLKTISRLGVRNGWSRIDPILFADGVAHKEVLGHIRHMAEGFGFAAERAPAGELGSGRDGIVLRDAVTLHRPKVEPALDHWLEALGALRIDDRLALTIADDGRAAVTIDQQDYTFGQTVLVGDAAILRYLPEANLPENLAVETTSTILTEPTALVSAPIMYQLDRRQTLLQPAQRGITAMGPGDIDSFTAGLSELLGNQRNARQAGQSTYRRVVTRDGAPAVGRLGGRGADIVAGFGMPGAFFAPALARWLVGATTPDEQDWFSARLVDRAFTTSQVGEAGGPV